jgi:hypothetical protein
MAQLIPFVLSFSLMYSLSFKLALDIAIHWHWSSEFRTIWFRAIRHWTASKCWKEFDGIFRLSWKSFHLFRLRT